MNSFSQPLLLAASAGMMLSWLSVLPNSLVLLVAGRGLPPSSLLMPFGLALCISVLARFKRLRVIWALLLHIAGFSLSTLYAAHLFVLSPQPFFDLTWLFSFVNTSHSPLEWLLYVLIVLWTFGFWTGGVVLARHPLTYAIIRSRFDLGLSIFCLLFCVKFLVALKGGTPPQENTSLYLLILFFLCSLTAFGQCEKKESARWDFLSPYRGTGVILSYAALVLLLGGGLVLAVLPLLNQAADVGLQGLQKICIPLVPVIVAVLRFIFSPRALDRDMTSNPPQPEVQGQAVSMPEASPWLDGLMLILGILLLMLLGLALLLCSALALRSLLRWLLSTSPALETFDSERSFLILWLENVHRFLDRCLIRILNFRKQRQNAFDFYQALLAWGKRSGVEHHFTETPLEYSRRLIRSFPDLAPDITNIIQAFHQEYYGLTILSQARIDAAQQAWGRLCSPRLWWARFRSKVLPDAKLTKDVAKNETMM